MKHTTQYLYFFALLLALGTSAAAQDSANLAVKPTTDPTVKVPDATQMSCQKATQILGNMVMKGDMQYAYDHVYPRYKKRQERLHGEKKFKQQFLDAPKILNQMGVTIDSFVAEKPVSFFRVWPQIRPAAKLKVDSGVQKELKNEDIFYNWLIIVPTTQVWTFRNQNGGLPRKLKREGFQVAVAQEATMQGQEKWMFIDGGTIKPQKLRSIFPSLPQTLVLPQRKDSEIK